MVGMTSLLLLSVSTLAFGSPVWPRADNATLTTSSVAFDATLPAISPEIITPSSIAGDFSVAETTSTTTTATASTASASIATAASSSASASASDADGAQLAPLSGTLTVLGEPKDQLLAAYGDGPIDVRVLADLMAANWSAPAPVNLEPQRKKFEGWAKDKWYIDLQYHVAVTECERPKPVVVDVDPFLVCNGGLCKLNPVHGFSRSVHVTDPPSQLAHSPKSSKQPRPTVIDMVTNSACLSKGATVHLHSRPKSVPASNGARIGPRPPPRGIPIPMSSTSLPVRCAVLRASNSLRHASQLLSSTSSTLLLVALP